MKSLSLNPSILVKDNGESALVVDLRKSEIFHFEGDVAKLLVILSEKKNTTEVSEESLQGELAKRSKSFAKNKFKKQCVSEAIEYFKTKGLLE